MAIISDASQLFSRSPATILASLVGILVLSYITYTVIYNLFLSPLRHIPGPKLWATSEIFFSRLLMSGTGHKQLSNLHAKYGDIVRVSPLQVSFNQPEAWKDIYGHRKAGQLENQKDPIFYKLASPSVIVAEDSEDHGRQRKVMAHAFSAQALLEQQPIMKKYVDLLIKRLKELTGTDGTVVNMVKWYDFTTFDLVGDLSFGEPFGCLEESKYDPWVSMIFAGVKEAVFLIQIRRWIPNIDFYLHKYATVLLAKLLQHHELTNAKVAKRMARKTDRPDFMQALTATDEDGNRILPLIEIQQNASLFVIAGSETTATALGGATYLLCSNPAALAKLTEEVRSAFSSEEDINLLSVQKLKYMHAVLEEALRMFPPIPGPAPRMIHSGGEMVCGQFIPEGTVVNVWQTVQNYNPENFALADEFHPERWLGDERFKDDKRDAFQPFSLGSRVCIGKK
ncbi:hypothetical protein DL546_003123 [Coniochaeta pulveracea]|uniref:Uncharacterized protein n=1 Tax=Coniochaeta pulveracea TaxID=177199 RepID=A0A420XZV4_9PEZI|nr:hypothetical protein DL546_003123 [Coniochaeta pulveracea]